MSIESEIINAMENLTKKKSHSAEVVRHGSALIVPEGMPLDGAIDVLTKRRNAEEQVTSFNSTFNCFPWEGALALERALNDVLGYMQQQSVETFFGSKPPARVEVQVGYGETKKVIWGRVQLSTDGGFLETGVQMDDGMVKFQLFGQFKAKHQYLVDKIAERLRVIIETEPFYQGKALTMKFTDDNGHMLEMPSIQFYNFQSSEVDALTFSRSIEQIVGSNILAPIQHRDACERAGVPFKRGVLLAGKYGTGKTLLARKVARTATSSGVTFIYIKNVRDLPHAINFARNYQPAVIFGEDIDRVMGTNARTEEIDTVLNTLDGIESKNTNVMVVLTTNHLENINKAMLRPGRIDVLVEVTPPDAEAALRLVHVYGNGLVESTLSPQVGHALNGLIPAIIREIVERAELVHIYRTSQAPTAGSISSEDLLGAAESMKGQLAVLNREPENPLSIQEKAAQIIAAGHMEAAKHSTLYGNLRATE